MPCRLLAFLALAAVRAAPLSELSVRLRAGKGGCDRLLSGLGALGAEADDECLEEGCALSALHLRSAKRSQARALSLPSA